MADIPSQHFSFFFFFCWFCFTGLEVVAVVDLLKFLLTNEQVEHCPSRGS